MRTTFYRDNKTVHCYVYMNISRRGEYFTMSVKEKIKSAVTSAKKALLGTYEGECADSNITNKNGMDITRPVWETVFASEEYKKAIELGHYIGYLGHPEDPNCMDFKNACIVMTEGHIDTNGKVYGKFNLIDTPVGRIVKAFQDAGVQFGISVRGVGDVIDNSVDPETFIFRGFDLVTFPAFPESIPTFNAIAASTDLEHQAKYRAVCAAVTANLQDVTSSSAIDIIQQQFAAQSDEYAALSARKDELSAQLKDAAESKAEELVAEDSTIVPQTSDQAAELDRQRVSGLTNLLLEQMEQVRLLQEENNSLRRELQSAQISASRQLTAVKRIAAAQLVDATKAAESAAVRAENAEARCTAIQAAYNTSKARVASLEKDLSHSERSNLTYQHKIEASSRTIQEKDNALARLRSQLRETVTAARDLEEGASNRDAEVTRLRQELVASEKLVVQYKTAYANMYANALGVDLKSVSIEAATSVAELQRIIGSTSTSNLGVNPAPAGFCEVVDPEDDDDGEIITM